MFAPAIDDVPAGQAAQAEEVSLKNWFVAQASKIVTKPFEHVSATEYSISDVTIAFA